MRLHALVAPRVISLRRGNSVAFGSEQISRRALSVVHDLISVFMARNQHKYRAQACITSLAMRKMQPDRLSSTVFRFASIGKAP